MSLLQVSDLVKTYPPEKKGVPSFTAVDGISFTLQEGEILGLLGPNGAGKSTTISMLLGVLTPTSGSIEYFGRDFFQHRSDVLQQVTFASTYINMPWRLTVWENLRVYGALYGLDARTFKKRAEKFLVSFGVWEQRDKTMNALSAGQKTRVMLAKAFIPHPKIVLLDEPTASLDPDVAHQVRSFVKAQQAEFNTTILYTSHNMDEVADVCDRVLFLKQGKIVASDTPQNLARTITTSKVTLTVTKGWTDLQKLIKKFSAHILEAEPTYSAPKIQVITFSLEDTKIAEMLTALTKQGITFSQISITQPTLEDYFLQMSQS